MLALLAALAAALPLEASARDFRFRAIGFLVEARELYFVDGENVGRFELRDRLISGEVSYGGGAPLLLYAEPPQLDDPEAPLPPVVHRLPVPGDGQPRLIAFLPADGGTGDAGYRTIALRDQRSAASDGGTIRCYNFTRSELGIKLGDSLDRVQPLSLIEWRNAGEQRRAFVMLVAEDSNTDELRRLRSGYVRLSRNARTLLFVMPGTNPASADGTPDLRLFQVYDFL